MRGHVVEVVTADGTQTRLGVDRAGRWTTATASAPRYDVGDGLALPGLVDGHAHLTSRAISDMTDRDRRSTAGPRIVSNAADQLAGGVLVVVDKGTHDSATVDQTLEIEPEARPDVQLAGRFLAGRDGYYPELAVEVGPADLAPTAAAYGPASAAWVKVIGDWPRRGVGAVPNFDEPALRAAVGASHATGRRVAIHTVAPGTASIAVRAGVDSIEHGLFLTEDDIVRLGERRGAWVPTIRAMEDLHRSLRPGSSGATLLAEGLANAKRLLPHAVAAGVVVMAGTDLALAHGAVAGEGAALIEYGMNEADAVAALTSGPRAFLGVRAFAEGGWADFVMVTAPTVAALAEPLLVVRCGRVVVDRRR
jgi:imidazolonepropionase-like amidohydrolase